jgi:7-carboxy-7-deazaguanine synthase
MRKVVEIFLSVQGEGFDVGSPALFVRFSGCNLNCGFCDTEFDEYEELSDDQLISRILDKVSENGREGFLLVFTGGEPLLSLDVSFVERVKSFGFDVAVETNGTVYDLPVLSFVDRVVVSPKERQVGVGFDSRVLPFTNVLKLLVPLKGPFESAKDIAEVVKAHEGMKVVLQPITDKDLSWNSRRAQVLLYELLGLGVKARLIPQTHVFMSLK